MTFFARNCCFRFLLARITALFPPLPLLKKGASFFATLPMASGSDIGI